MGRKSSSIWNYFTVIDRENCTATCNLCNNNFSYRTSISNLKKHLSRSNHALHVNLDPDTEAVEYIELDGLPEDVNSAEEEDVERGQANRCELVIEEGVIPQGQNQSDDILDISHNTFNTLQADNIGSEQDKDLSSVSGVNIDLRQAFQNGIEGITDTDLNGKNSETSKGNEMTQKESPKTTKFLRPRANSVRGWKLGNSVSSSLGMKGRTSSTFAADSSSDNEFELFGRHVGSQLRKLSKVNSFLAQDEIQSILTRYRIYESMSDNNRRSILNSEK